jgi:hypothetical protein
MAGTKRSTLTLPSGPVRPGHFPERVRPIGLRRDWVVTRGVMTSRENGHPRASLGVRRGDWALMHLSPANLTSVRTPTGDAPASRCTDVVGPNSRGALKGEWLGQQFCMTRSTPTDDTQALAVTCHGPGRGRLRGGPVASGTRRVAGCSERGDPLCVWAMGLMSSTVGVSPGAPPALADATRRTSHLGRSSRRRRTARSWGVSRGWP